VCTILLVGCANLNTQNSAPLRGVTELVELSSDSGIDYTLASMPDAAEVAIHVAWPNTGVYSSADNSVATVSTLGVDLMVSGGAGAYSAEQIKEQILALGSKASIVSAPDHIYATFVADQDKLAQTLEIARAVLQSPDFNAERLDTIKSALRKRVEARLQKDTARLWSVVRRSLLGDSGLSNYWNNLPLALVVDPVTVDGISAWHKNTLTSNTATVVVAGAIDTQGAADAIDTLLSELPRVESSGAIDTVGIQDIAFGRTILLVDKNIEAAHIAVVGNLPPSSEGNETADIVAVGALGKGSESRMVEAVEQFESAVLNTSVANFSRDVRVFGLSGVVANDSVSGMLSAMQTAYELFRSDGLSDEEVLKSTVTFANTLNENDQQVDLIAYGIGQLQIDKLSKERVLTIREDTMALQSADINERISDYYPAWGNLLKVVMSADESLIDTDCVISSIDELASCGL